jgi:hypothetical protein
MSEKAGSGDGLAERRRDDDAGGRAAQDVVPERGSTLTSNLQPVHSPQPRQPAMIPSPNEFLADFNRLPVISWLNGWHNRAQRGFVGWVTDHPVVALPLLLVYLSGALWVVRPFSASSSGSRLQPN